MKRRKSRITVNNRIKTKGGKRAAFGDYDPETKKIRINLKAHVRRGKLDRAELASTIKHESLHHKHPKMTEKEVYRRSKKTALSEKEQAKLLAKLPKRFKPGSLFNAAKK